MLNKGKIAVAFLIFCSNVVLAVSGPSLSSLHSKYKEPINHAIYMPGFCQSFRILHRLQNSLMALTYNKHRIEWEAVPLSNNNVLPKHVWLALDFNTVINLAIIVPYLDQNEALYQSNNKVILEDKKFARGWHIGLVPYAGFFKFSKNNMGFNGKYLSFGYGNDVELSNRWDDSSTELELADAITGNSCSDFLSERYSI